ncbi:epidermal growth factor-like protein [Battus philenor]|uniref:epidermal growth factor-like protein n=1 Tax=Battus philenor TaxID=42288 RepID=UPI0035CF3DE6
MKATKAESYHRNVDMQSDFNLPTITEYFGELSRRYFQDAIHHLNQLVAQAANKKKVVKVREICCDGYIDVSDYSWSINCKPICMPTCTNGYCKSPGKCACNVGYKVDLENNHVCQPVCTNGCQNGNCVAPNKCECKSGYIQYNGTCQPFCLEPCDNGVCIAPDTCECLPGYRKSEENFCKPYCFSGCPNGICIAPDECRCNSGYQQVNGTCKPICTKPCKNATCIAPDTCECLPGYIKSEGICQPSCSSGCPNGICIGPDICQCNDGWIKNEENDLCIPQCKFCGNGTCVAPNTCECFPGYEIDANDTFSDIMCVPICHNCINGSCFTPNECTCEPPLIANKLPINGCSNFSMECYKTVCVENLPTSTTPTEVTTDESTEFNKNDSFESTNTPENSSKISSVSNNIDVLPEEDILLDLCGCPYTSVIDLNVDNDFI